MSTCDHCGNKVPDQEARERRVEGMTQIWCDECCGSEKEEAE